MPIRQENEARGAGRRPGLVIGLLAALVLLAGGAVVYVERSTDLISLGPVTLAWPRYHGDVVRLVGRIYVFPRTDADLHETFRAGYAAGPYRVLIR
jgi:hypothetical protein